MKEHTSTESRPKAGDWQFKKRNVMLAVFSL
jgi:hypothetical protein